MRIIIGGHRGTDRASQGAADNRTIPAADFIADRRPGSSAYAAADCRVKSGIASIRLYSHQRNRQRKIFDIHNGHCIPVN